MDEEKRKYLEDLKKQIDPSILEKMAQHLGKDGDDGAAAHSSGSVSAGSSTISRPSSPADKIRERKASAFQRKVAERKRQEMMPPEKKNEARRVLLIYSHNEFWSRIAESQFKSMGFQEAESHYAFDQLVRGVFNKIGKGEKNIMVAVSLTRIATFMKGWRQLQEQMTAQGKPNILEQVKFMLVVESMKQVPEEVLPVIGLERVIDLTAENQVNREKIGKLTIQSAASESSDAE